MVGVVPLNGPSLFHIGEGEVLLQPRIEEAAP